uniref:Uncharacterized protein n=1 Tax=Arundo donax TaxID=35708 RepID=A0A0A9C9N4_ARUDO
MGCSSNALNIWLLRIEISKREGSLVCILYFFPSIPYQC